MKQNLLAIFLLSIILLQSCCKKEGNGIDPTHDMDSIKAYAYFLPGTYWIYEDNTGNIDSMYVVSASSGYDTAHAADFFISRWHSTYDTYDYIVEWNTTWTTYNPIRHQVFMTKTKLGDYVGQITLMEYPPIIGNVLYHGGVVTTKNLYNTLSVSSNNFNSVIKINNTADITNNDQESNYYIAKKFGVVQEDLIDSNNVWKLIRYNIIQ